jgi:WD40 repeat protein
MGDVLMKRGLILMLLLLATALFAGVSALAAQDTANVETIAFESLAAGVKLSPDDRTLAVFNNPVIYNDEEIISPPELVQIRLFDAETGEQTGSLLGHLDWVMDADFNSDGSQLVTYHRNGDLTLWDVASQSVVRTIETYTMGGGWVHFMPDDTTVVVQLGELIFGTLDMESGAITRLYGRHMGTYNLFSEQYMQTPARTDLTFLSMAVSPDGATFATSTGNDEVILWDVASGDTRTLREKSEQPLRFAIRALYFSSDGSTLTYYDRTDNQVHRWDVAAGTETGAYALPAGAFAVSPDETWIAWADRETNTVYWVESMVLDAPEHEFELPENVEIAPVITTLAFTTDGTKLVVGGLYASDEDNAIYVIDLSE